MPLTNNERGKNYRDQQRREAAKLERDRKQCQLDNITAKFVLLYRAEKAAAIERAVAKQKDLQLLQPRVPGTALETPER